jgi:hypothetical protein
VNLFDVVHKKSRMMAHLPVVPQFLIKGTGVGEKDIIGDRLNNHQSLNPFHLRVCLKQFILLILTSTSKRHIMISYNWANQPIIKQIAQSLKDHGYNVWLDLEQMGGSTLEASIIHYY